MTDAVKLVGLDFGTTTSSAVVASARLTRSAVTGRIDLTQVSECYRSDMVFTPLGADDRIDEQQVEEHLDSWLEAGRVRAEEVFGGGALLTGLTAQKENAAALVHLIRRRLGNALVATADDPCLESWLAFMGSCAGLSRSRPELSVLNVDIGGGTTNLALGRAGEVSRTGCLFVGARHVQVKPGTYRIERLSPYAAALFERLGIQKDRGDCLDPAEVDAVVDFYTELLETAALGRPRRVRAANQQSSIIDLPSEDPVVRMYEQVPFRPPTEEDDVAVTFSGGVGELIYAHLQGKPWPPTTCFGDLGIDLARRLAQAPIWLAHLRRHVPASAGRATVYGLLRHGTEVSGSTLFLPDKNVLPLPDLPILGTVSPASSDTELRDVFALVLRSRRAGCVRVELERKVAAPPVGRICNPSHETEHFELDGHDVGRIGNPSHERASSGGREDAALVCELGGRLASILRALSFPAAQPVVLLLRENAGKTLGHYVTEWGALPLCLIVIDEVAMRDAQYLHIGRQRDQVVPVSYYGLTEGSPHTPPEFGM